MKQTESRHWEALEAQISTLTRFQDKWFIQALRHMWRISDGSLSVEQAIAHQIAMLRRAETYYWSPKICTLIEAAAPPMPTWTFTRESLLSPHGWFYFAAPLPLPFQYPPEVKEGAVGPLVAIGWLGLHTADEGVAVGEEVHFTIADTPDQVTHVFVTYFVDFDGVTAPVTTAFIRHGDHLNTIDAAYTESTQRQHDYDATSHQLYLLKTRYFAACLSFLEQKILTSERQGVPRHVRRRMPEVNEDTVVRTIYLRRISPRKPDEESEPVEWSHRWLVRGHWRQQWYAIEQLHKPKWIHPFIKGPEDKPLKVPEKMYKVVR